MFKLKGLNSSEAILVICHDIHQTSQGMTLIQETASDFSLNIAVACFELSEFCLCWKVN